MPGFVIIAILLVTVYGFAWLQKRVYSRYWNRNLSYSLSLSRKAVFEGEKITITDSLTNGKRLPLPWVHVSYRISRFLVYLDNINKRIDRGERRSLIYLIGMNKTVSRKSTVLCSKRGCYRATGFSISCNNLLMTHFETKNLDLMFELLVYPRIVDYPESVIPLKKLLGDVMVRRFIDPDPFTFKGIREYQPYDSFRQINWGATARTGEMMTNIYDFTLSQDITVLLNLQDYNRFDRDFVHEEAIRLAAFLCRRCVSMGLPVSLVCPGPDGKPVRIGSGLSETHLRSVYTALAYINLLKTSASVVDWFPIEPGKSTVLISSYHKGDILEQFISARERDAGALWIIPFCGRDGITAPTGGSIMTWEVYEDAEV